MPFSQASGEEVHVDPRRMYPLSEAADLIPSCRAGKRVLLKTLRRWIKDGHLHGEPRLIGGKQWWFVPGAEILRLTDPPEEVVKVRIRGPKERAEAIAAAEQKLKKLLKPVKAKKSVARNKP